MKFTRQSNHVVYTSGNINHGLKTKHKIGKWKIRKKKERKKAVIFCLQLSEFRCHPNFLANKDRSTLESADAPLIIHACIKYLKVYFKYFAIVIFADLSYPRNSAKIGQPQKIPVIRYYMYTVFQYVDNR